VVPLRLRESLSNVGQLLEHDYVTVVFDGFCDEFVSDRVDVLFPPCFFALPESKQGVVRGLRAALLHLSTSLLELTAPMVVVVSLPERAGRGDGETVDAEVDTEDRLVGVPGICRNLCVISVAVFPPSRNVTVELVGRRVVPKRTLAELVVLGENIPFVGRRAVCRENERRFDRFGGVGRVARRKQRVSRRRFDTRPYFRESATVVECSGVGRSQYAGCVVPCRLPP